MAEIVMVDTTAWITYFRTGTCDICDRLDLLLARRRAGLCGVVELELLQGIRPAERDHVVGLLDVLPFFPADRACFRAAGDISNTLRRRGVTIPSTDCLIAAICLRNDLKLLTLDRHFDQLPEVQRFKP